MGGIPGMEGNTLTGNAIGAGATEIGLDPSSGSPVANATFNAIGNIPGMMASMGTTAHRGSNTIVAGTSGIGMTGNTVHDMIKQNFNRKAWKNYGSLDIFNPVAKGSGKVTSATNPRGWRGQNRAGYSPFNMSSQINEKVTSMVGKAAENGTMNKGVVGRLNRAGLITPGAENQHIMDAGMLSRISSIGKINGSAGGRISEKMASSLNEFTRKAGTLGPGIGKAGPGGSASGHILGRHSVGGTPDLFFAGQDVKQATSGYLSHGFQSSFGQATGGYIHGAMGLGTESQIGTSSKVFGKYAMKGARHLAELNEAGSITKMASKRMASAVGKEVGEMGVGAVTKMAFKEGGMKAVGAGAKGLAVGAMAKGAGRAAGMLIPGVNIAMAAWTAWDLTKMAIDLTRDLIIKPGMEMARDGFKSYKGQIDKSPFGMGFKDNSVSMTSRQRGVSAIQNSRLNARSVLGAEAGMMSQHFS